METTHKKPAMPEDIEPVWIEPDLDFIQLMNKQGGELLKKCFQCGTCSATCAISPDYEPFPRKEMAWAVWGMKDHLLKDVDIWLCYQCNDCSIRCPRGARPGDVFAAVRQEVITHYAFPKFMGRWVNQPQYLPLLLGLPIAILGLLLYVKTGVGKFLGFTPQVGDEITYAYSSVFPHWILNIFFFLITALVLTTIIYGNIRFWKAMQSFYGPNKFPASGKSVWISFVTVFKGILAHTKFSECKESHSRYYSHLLVFFGFSALLMVTFWVITSGINPFIKSNFIYPFSFFSPWKILANMGGLALLGGCFLMIKNRFLDQDHAGASSYFDWAFIGTLFLVVLSGFATEAMHLIRLEPHRHVIYFAHLVFICALFMYLPYSKFAHVFYRTTALAFAEYSGRNLVPKQAPTKKPVPEETTEKSGVENE